MKAICQECGQELSSWTETHDYQACGRYHLKRAEEILGFSLRNMEIYQKESAKYKAENEKAVNNLVSFHDWLLEALKTAETACGKESTEYFSLVSVIGKLAAQFEYPFLQFKTNGQKETSQTEEKKV